MLVSPLEPASLMPLTTWRLQHQLERDTVTAVLHDLQRAFRGAREAFERR